MAHIKSRKHTKTKSLVAIAAVLPLMAHAAQEESDITKLPTIAVQAKEKAENKYKTNSVSSAKYTQPLVDTPQTISVINKEILCTRQISQNPYPIRILLS